MKITTFQTRLERVGRKGTSAFKIVSTVSSKGQTLRLCYTSGSGRFTSNMDYTYDVERLLDAMKVKYISGNDSVRGGKTGNFITILTELN